MEKIRLRIQKTGNILMVICTIAKVIMLVSAVVAAVLVIVAVADVYDALTSKRSYKEAWDDKRAYEEIVKGSGTQFDSEVVEVFKKAYDRINSVRIQFADA